MDNKFTLFTLSVSIIIILIVAEIMVGEYLPSQQVSGSADVFRAHQTQVQTPATSLPLVGSSQQTGSVGSLSSALMQKAGLGDYVFQSNPYGGKLFDRIAFADLSFIPTFESHLVKNQSSLVASFYEFNAGSIDSAKEAYALIKQKSAGDIGVIINETNSIGDGSFYVNYFEFPEKVFVTFRKGMRVFAFTYSKDLQKGISKLIGLL